jgi:N-acetyl-gamma-glutamyl-phosphate reductase common form
MSTIAKQPIPAWIVGSSGLLAGELARLIEGHPGLELAAAVSREGGRSLCDMHPHLSRDLETVALEGAGHRLQQFLEAVDRKEPGACLALFLGLPHGQSAAVWKALAAELGEHAARVAVVDLSADYRITSPELFEHHYSTPHPDPDGEEGFVYGLPEFWRGRILESRRVAAPGCFATALQLAVLPAAIEGALDAEQPWILNAVTGSSGSGVAPKKNTHHPFRHGSYKAYSPSGHRHEAELQQALAEWFIEAPLHFLPHSGPWSRGIHLSASLPVAPQKRDELAIEDFHAIYSERYRDEPFVEVLPLGGVPELRAVVGSNRTQIGVHLRGGVLTVLLALDNTIKGGSGQALQCMNLMLGQPEEAGLPKTGLGY